MNKKITTRMPAGSWMYKNAKGERVYTDLYRLIHIIANSIDNSAIEQSRPYPPYVLELVQKELIRFDREHIPSIGSLSMYLNTNRTNAFPDGYHNKPVPKQNRIKIHSVIAKRK